MYSAEHYRANKETIRARRKEYREHNKEWVLERKRAYRQANRREVLSYGRRYREENAELLRAKNCAYYRAHKEQNLERGARRRALQYAAEGTYTRADVWRIYDEQGGCCAYCDHPLFGYFHIDHRVPLSRGGNNWPENLCVSCPTCNRSKGAKTHDEFVAMRLKNRKGE